MKPWLYLLSAITFFTADAYWAIPALRSRSGSRNHNRRKLSHKRCAEAALDGGSKIIERAGKWLRSKPKRWHARLFLFWLFGRVPTYSILWDEWAAMRLASGSETSIKANIFRRRQRAARVQKMIALGYTPRIVALAGLMLRSLHLSTSLPAVWDPPLGLGAGACMAAHWAQREWLSCLMVGWYAGGIYWRVMGVEAPKGFNGVPVAVQRVRV